MGTNGQDEGQCQAGATSLQSTGGFTHRLGVARSDGQCNQRQSSEQRTVRTDQLPVTIAVHVVRPTRGGRVWCRPFHCKYMPDMAKTSPVNDEHSGPMQIDSSNCPQTMVLCLICWANRRTTGMCPQGVARSAVHSLFLDFSWMLATNSDCVNQHSILCGFQKGRVFPL